MEVLIVRNESAKCNGPHFVIRPCGSEHFRKAFGCHSVDNSGDRTRTWASTVDPGTGPTSEIHDRGERLRVEARASDQCAVYVAHRHQPRDVVGLDAATVE